VIGLFKPTFIIRDAGTLPVNCRPPGSCRSRFGSWKQRSRKEATHLLYGAGYKWAYTARRGFLPVLRGIMLALMLRVQYNTFRYANIKKYL